MEVVNMRDHTLQNDQTYIKKRDTTLQEISIQNPSPPPPTATTSPPSASASPTHEFSFTISLNPSPPPKSTQDTHRYFNNTTYNIDNNTTTTTTTTTTNNNNNYDNDVSLTPPPEPLTAIDLSPADDIFFHGHLLPLHLLSHLPVSVSPRSSTNSMDSFTLPMRDILKDQHNPIGNTSFHYHHRNTFSDFNLPNNNNVNQTRPKSKSFSIFGRSKLKKGQLDQDQEQERNNNNSKKKLKQEVAQLIKRYMKMVRPFMSFTKEKRPNNTEFNRQPHSFSGNLLSSRRNGLPVDMNNKGVGKRGKFSAPASMRTSPTNSGILMASGTVSPAKSTTSDSTMEELQAAIQAAIAHCKNSIAIEDKVQA
ncbi:BRI1 kinase inhibitor 1-like [Bidens hawaiensis]|uniref:BRI1 kinase inhibitor 1-like n=1 Tax=Bidens hawaiensis TaxID=980011 RepID=UPI00404AD444